MRNIWDKFLANIAPIIIGVCWVVTFICVSVGAAIWAITWLLKMLGVM